MFQKDGQYFFVTIDNKVINYYDKLQGAIWGGPLQYLPPSPAMMRKIEMSRNKIPPHYKELLKITKDELEEFKKAKTDEELKEIVLRDCKNKGCKLIDEKKE